MNDLLFCFLTFFSNSKTLGGVEAKRSVQKFHLHYSIQRKMFPLDLREYPVIIY